MSHAMKVRLAILVGFPVLIGLVLGANQTRAGAYLPWHLSIGYWVLISILTWWALAASTWITAFIVRPWNIPGWVSWIVGGMMGSFAARYLIYFTAFAFQPFMVNPELRVMPTVTFDLEFARYYATNWSAILLLWVLACAIEHFVTSREPVSEAPVSNARPKLAESSTNISEVPAIGFFARLPAHIGKNIVALHSEDHYLRVYTSLGEALVLGRLSDAIELCEARGLTGTRVHRSWWVVDSAVASNHIDGRKVFLLLDTGTKVPVSLSYREIARTAGLLSIKTAA
jgi:LytTr DNA-binding domain